MSIHMQGRIKFIDDLEILEVDFSNMHFETSKDVHHAYDALEDAINNSEWDKWFFLVDYINTKIDPDAWFAFSQRGKQLNLSHSQGSVRFDPSEETKAEIERRAGTDAFDANLFSDRDDAIKRIAEFKSQRLAKVVHEENLKPEDLDGRITFLPDDRIMDINFKNLVLSHSDDVNLVYDRLEEEIAGSSHKKWFFLINYENCRIFPEAWISYSQRGKSLNINHSLGSVRYAPGSETEQEIRMRAESQDFRPNIRNSRAEALDRISELRVQA